MRDLVKIAISLLNEIQFILPLALQEMKDWKLNENIDLKSWRNLRTCACADVCNKNAKNFGIVLLRSSYHGDSNKQEEEGGEKAAKFHF